MLRDIKKLFDQISRDNEVLRVFANHSLRVMHFAVALGKKAGCDSFDLRAAALFHDIGKIGLSKEILFKPGRLNELEYTIIQSHCHIGNTILRNIAGLHKAATYVRDHHEYWNGRGYPRKLRGEAISIQGRIINICDAFDTMTIERRTYKQETLSYEAALEELKRCSWQQFDGALVDRFVNLVAELELPDSRSWYEEPERMKEVFGRQGGLARFRLESLADPQHDAEFGDDGPLEAMSKDVKTLLATQQEMKRDLEERDRILFQLLQEIQRGQLAAD